jgi:hypothetical protein
LDMAVDIGAVDAGVVDAGVVMAALMPPGVGAGTPAPPAKCAFWAVSALNFRPPSGSTGWPALTLAAVPGRFAKGPAGTAHPARLTAMRNGMDLRMAPSLGLGLNGRELAFGG